MKKYFLYKIIMSLSFLLILNSCGKDYLELTPKGSFQEVNFYQTEDEFFQGLVAVYDVLQWGSTKGIWSMNLGLLNAASDDCFAGGSDASDQPNWVAYDNFTLNPALGPQEGLWAKYYAGIYRANLILEKLEQAPAEISTSFKARTVAEAKFLRAYFYFDLVKFFGNVPLITTVLSPDEIKEVVQSTPDKIYGQIEEDLNAARAEPELPESVGPNDFGRVTQGAITALLGKVILYQNNEARMGEAADLFEEVINSGFYFLETNFEDVFSNQGEFGPESVFEIQHSSNKPGGWGEGGFVASPVINPTEGNLNIQFFGMRDYVGPTYATGWSFCPVSEDLVDFMLGDPRMEHTIIDGNVLKAQGATYAEGFQNTDYFIRKYAPLEGNVALDGEIPLGWGTNERVIRLADVYLMAAEAIVRSGGSSSQAREYINKVRNRVGLSNINTSVNGDLLLDVIYKERRLELATEGHRFFDLVRTGKAAQVLDGFVEGVHELLPVPLFEIDLTNGRLQQNPGY